MNKYFAGRVNHNCVKSELWEIAYSLFLVRHLSLGFKDPNELQPEDLVYVLTYGMEMMFGLG